MSEQMNVVSIFGENVFNDSVMQARLPKKVYNELTNELMSEYGVVKLEEDYYAVEFMNVNAKETDYDGDIAYIDSKVGELQVHDGDTLIAAPISRNEVQIWNTNNYKHDVVINGYMGSDDTTFYFLNSLGRWFLENKNVDVDVVTHLYYSKEQTLDYINSLQWENL